MNVDWLAKLPAPVRRALYFGLQRGLGSRIGATWREFLAWETFAPAQHDQAVDAKLTRLLTAATTHSEYYRKLGLARRRGESARDWLRRFPTLDRSTLRDNLKLKKELSGKVSFLQHFLEVMNEKFSIHYEKIKVIYNGIINDIFLSFNYRLRDSHYASALCTLG